MTFAFAFSAVLAVATTVEPDAIRLRGRYGAILDRMIERQVEATDAVELADVYRRRVVRDFDWKTEFWGKYMHTAVPFQRYSGRAELKRRIDASVSVLLSTQDPDGYIGDCAEPYRFTSGGNMSGYDTWNYKYTMLGLLHYYDGERAAGRDGAKVLEALKGMGDCLIAGVRRDEAKGIPLRYKNQCFGLGPCSILEPVVWLYRRTGEKRYLELAGKIVKELTDYPDGPELVRQASTPLARRVVSKLPAYAAAFENQKWFGNHVFWLRKAYEQMSCYQGLLEYWEVTHRDEYLEATIASARDAVRNEINLAGGASAGEYWYSGATNETRNVGAMMETCVLTTWMRLCEKLLVITRDPFWADQLEKTFFNAYLAAHNPDGTCFATYTPLSGYRSYGYNHCRMDTNCCNVNGPRGYLALLESLLMAEGDKVFVNQYVSGTAEIGGVRIRQYTKYPRRGNVQLWYDSGDVRTFTLALRIPAFSRKAVLALNNAPLSVRADPGSYCEIRREWRHGDKLTIDFDMPVVMHRKNEHVAFSRGPVCLARDTRFDDGPLDEVIRASCLTERDLASFTEVRPLDDSMGMAFAAMLPSGYHSENHDLGSRPRLNTFHFTDFASAGCPWSTGNRYRVWLPELVPGRAE